MNHNRPHFGSSSVNSDESSQQLIKNAFDRLYERSPLPELLQSHLGNSPKKRFHGTGNATPSDRFNQIYASLKKTRKTDTSLSHSDHSASFSHNNSFSKDYVRNSPHLNRSSDSVFRSPVQHWMDTSFSKDAENRRLPNQNQNNYTSEFLLRHDNEKNVRHDIEVYGDNRDKFVGEFTQGVNSQVPFRDDHFREDFECDSENHEIIERGAHFKSRQLQYRKDNYDERDSQNSNQPGWRYCKENVDTTGMSGCQWDIQNLDMLKDNQDDNQFVSPVIPIQGGGRKPPRTHGPVHATSVIKDQTHSRYEILRSEGGTSTEERSVNNGRETTVDYNSESDFERQYIKHGDETAKSDGSDSDIDLIPSQNEDITLRLTDHNSVTENQDYEGNHDLKSISCQGTVIDTEDNQVHLGSAEMADQDAEEVSLDQPSEAAIDKESLGKKGKFNSDDNNGFDNREENEEVSTPIAEDTTEENTMEDTLEDVTAEDTMEDEPDKTEKEKAAGKVANKEERILYEWIIKPVESAKGVCVEGKQSESANEEFWKSSVIRERINKTTVQTASGTVYKLIGDIDLVYALNEGFSKKLVTAFCYGFPKNWKQLIAGHFDDTERLVDSDEDHKQEKAVHKKPEEKKNKSKVKNLTTKKNHKFMSPVNTRGTQDEENFDTLVCTPEGQFVDLKNLKKTRSGRMVKPPLFWWMGQQIVTDSDKVELSAVTSHAKDHIQGIAHIYSGTKAKRKQTPNLNRSYNTKKIKLNKSLNKTVGNVVDMESSYKKVPSNKSLRSSSNKSSNSELVGSCQNKKINRRKKGKKDANNSTSLTDVDCYSQCSDSENLDPVKDIEKTLQKSRSSRLKCTRRKGKCYDDSDSTSKKEESAVSDVYIISSDEEKTTRLGKRNSSKRQQKNTRKNTSSVKHSSTGEQSQSDLSSAENQKSEKCDKKKKTEKMSRVIQDSEKSDVRVTRSRVSDSSNLLSSLKSNNKVTRSRSRSQDTEQIRLRSQTKPTEPSCRSLEEGKKNHKHDGDNEGNKHSVLSRKSRRSARKTRTTILDYSSSEEYVPNIKKNRLRKRTTSKPNSSHCASEDSDSDDFSQKTGTVGRNRTMSHPQNKQEKSVRETGNIWSSSEVKRLRQALASTKADHPDFWHLVQQKVMTKTVEECQQHHWKESEVRNQKKSRKDKSANHGVNGKVVLTAGQGTMKRKQQLRSLMEQHNEGHEDDLCDGTPFRNRTKSKVPHMGEGSDEENEEELFNEVKRMNPTLTNRIHTPVAHFHIEPVSQKKTPFNPLISPNEPVNRNEMDRYIHRVLKRRRLGNKQTAKGNTDLHKTPVNKPKSKYNEDEVPTPTKKLFDVTPGNVNSLLMFEEKSDSDNYANSEEDSDYYWTDMDQ